MAPLIPIAITGAIELIKLGADLLHTWKTNPEDQAAIDAKWAKMQAARDTAISEWEASKE
jgi:hypothetical protein